MKKSNYCPNTFFVRRLRSFSLLFIQQKHNKKIELGMRRNALSYICKTYQGTKPAECHGTEKNLDVSYRN